MSTARMASARSSSKIPPGPRGHIFLGTLPELQRNILGFVERVAQDYGDLARIRLLPGWHFFMLGHPNHYKHVLGDNNHKYAKESVHFDVLSLLVGRSVITLNGASWRKRRKVAQPAFHRRRVARFAEIMTAATLEMLERWRALGPSACLDIEKEMTHLTLTIATRSLLNVDFSGNLDVVRRAFGEANQFMAKRWANPLSLRLVHLPTPNNRAFAASIKTMDDLVYRIIAERRQSDEDPGDVLSMLLAARDEETGEKLSDRELRDELMTVLVAGHETSSALTWTWYLLSQNPEAEQKLHEELAAVLGGRMPTIEDLPQLSYARWVYEEALRFFPPGYVIGRRATADDEIDGYHIPAGTGVLLTPYATHRNPVYWDNPTTYDPSRFSEARSANRPTMAFLPFGAGPRFCMGAAFAQIELHLVIATMAQQFRLRQASRDPAEPVPQMSIRPRNGLPMRLEGRI
jgi:cytochrome P450